MEATSQPSPSLLVHILLSPKICFLPTQNIITVFQSVSFFFLTLLKTCFRDDKWKGGERSCILNQAIFWILNGK